MHSEFGSVFTGIRCFKSTFLLKVKEDTKLYQVPPRHVAYALQEPFQNREGLDEQQILVPLGVGEMAK